MRQPIKSLGKKTVADIKRITHKHIPPKRRSGSFLTGYGVKAALLTYVAAQSIFYKWSKDLIETGKRRLAADTARAATNDEIKDLRHEACDIKEVVAEQTLELRLLIKALPATRAITNEVRYI